MITLHLITDTLSDGSKAYGVKLCNGTEASVELDCVDGPAACVLMSALHDALNEAEQPASIGNDVTKTAGWTD